MNLSLFPDPSPEQATEPVVLGGGAPSNGTQTSKAAAEYIAPRVKGQKLDILKALNDRRYRVAVGEITAFHAPGRRVAPGMTRQEIEDETGHRLSSICARLSEANTGLIPMGLVEERGTRKSPGSGCQQAICHITERGRAVLEGAGK